MGTAQAEANPDAAHRELLQADLSEQRGRRQFAAIGAVMLLIMAFVPVFSGSSFELARYGVALAYIMAAIGLNLAFGYAGELVIGHSVIMAGGAYAAGMLSAHLGWSPFVAMPLGVLAGVGVGLIMMLPGLRVQGWYLGLITLFAVLVLPRVVVLAEAWTGGEFGLTGVKTIEFFGFRFADWMTFELTLVALALVWLATANFLRSGWGLRLRALRDARRAAEAVGIDLQRTRFAAYLLSSIPAALAGVLLAYTERFVNADSFGIGLALLLLTGVVLGGAGTIWGPLVGMVPLVALSFWVGPFSPYNAVTLGLGLMVGVIVFTDGFVPAISARFARIQTNRTGFAPAVPEAAAVHATAPIAVNPSAGSAVIVEVRGLLKRFGGLTALDGIDFELRQGRLCGLVGPNGSGKSTFLNALSGFIPPDAGSILVAGQDVTSWPTHRIARAGIGRTFQVPQLVEDRTVFENIEIGLLQSTPETLLGAVFGSADASRQRERRRGLALRAFQTVGLPADTLRRPASDLPLGLKRIVEVARAIASGPALLMLDEPAAGLNDEERVQLGELLRRLKATGMTILVVEHNVPFVLKFCDELALLESGVVTCRADLKDELPQRLVSYLSYAPARQAGPAAKA